MTNNLCPDCGANLAMVGRVHRCIPRPRGLVGNDADTRSAAGVTPIPEPPRGTYRYRDAEKWRAYMRDYMRKKRNKAN